MVGKTLVSSQRRGPV